MSALEHLAAQLCKTPQTDAVSFRQPTQMDVVLQRLKKNVQSSGSHFVSEDRLQMAVRRFWERPEISTFRQAYLLSWGLCLPCRPSGPSILDDKDRFQRVLTAVDHWHRQPRTFRRCYQGLVRGYFAYDGSYAKPREGRENWERLRDYLHARNALIRDGGHLNPAWVDVAIEHRRLFTDTPCEPYARAVLEGDDGLVRRLAAGLQIAESSWFMRELVLAQIQWAVQQSDEVYLKYLPVMLELLAGNQILRDEGLGLLLSRYAQVPDWPLHMPLRDYSVESWGNPWLPSNLTPWLGVAPEVRTMVGNWLKGELIEAFFMKLAQDGTSDRRRVNFWKRYVKAIDKVEFALGSNARRAWDADFVTLRKKMTGLTAVLDAPGANNAFVMWMGDLVAVEFSQMSNAFYGYRRGESLPFDTHKVLRLEVDGVNSLKHLRPQSLLRMSHQDGIHGWNRWEEMFAATLAQHFDIRPGMGTAGGSSDAAQVLMADGSRKISRGVARDDILGVGLQSFLERYNLSYEDHRPDGGAFWVMANDEIRAISKTLRGVGFQYRRGRGWWKK